MPYQIGGMGSGKWGNCEKDLVLYNLQKETNQMVRGFETPYHNAENSKKKMRKDRRRKEQKHGRRRNEPFQKDTAQDALFDRRVRSSLRCMLDTLDVCLQLDIDTSCFGVSNWCLEYCFQRCLQHQSLHYMHSKYRSNLHICICTCDLVCKQPWASF